MEKTQVTEPIDPGYLQPGEIIAERYRLERELGRGSMGTVWSAEHVTLGQRVAIKLIAAEHVDSPEARLRFGNEAKAAARLKSRHVVQIYDDGMTADGTPYIVMEYLQGETLEEKLERSGSLPLAEAVRVATHVCRALSRAHAQGIVHRDLKPANIFITRSEEDEHGWVAKVLDFGVAKVTKPGEASATKTGTLVGTPLFMSPEQVRGASRVDHRADIYSLGMLFYNMLTGKFAFDSPSYSDVLIKICLEPLPDLAEVAPWVSEPVRLWFSKACARDLAERFQSADEASEALHQAAGQPVGRGSIPDQVMGPSGTVVGYASPDTLAGTLAVDPEHTPIPSRTALLAGPRSSGTAVLEPGSRRAPAAAPMPATVLSGADAGSTWRAARRAAGRPTWPLFLAAGAGIGLALAGAAVLFIATRGEANPTPAAAPSPPAAALPLAPARPEPPAAPLTADPEPSSAPSAAASASAIAPRRPSATKATAPRPAPPPAPPPAEKVAPKRAAPDMGF